MWEENRWALTLYNDIFRTPKAQNDVLDDELGVEEDGKADDDVGEVRHLIVYR